MNKIKKFCNWYLSSWKDEWKMMLGIWFCVMTVMVAISTFGPEDNPRAIRGVDNLAITGIILMICMPVANVLGKSKNKSFNN